MDKSEEGIYYGNLCVRRSTPSLSALCSRKLQQSCPNSSGLQLPQLITDQLQQHQEHKELKSLQLSWALKMLEFYEYHTTCDKIQGVERRRYHRPYWIHFLRENNEDDFEGCYVPLGRSLWHYAPPCAQSDDPLSFIPVTELNYLFEYTVAPIFVNGVLNISGEYIYSLYTDTSIVLIF